MGVFNSVYVKCKGCSREVEFQSKVDDGCLTYSLGAEVIPSAILLDIDGQSKECRYCQTYNKIQLFISGQVV